MFGKLIDLWNKRGFEILLVLCIVFIFVYAVYCKFTKRSGTWNEQVYPTLKKSSKTTSRNQYDAYEPVNQPGKTSKGEIECKKVLESLFKKPFNKARPDFLRNPVTGGNFNLELDCYNEEIGLAVEYNGKQHYEYMPYFHRNKEAFLNQKYRDDMKRRLCKEERVTLIEVPYTIPVGDIRSFLIKECKQRSFI